MFPQDVVANAPRIISDLRAIFPPQQGTFLIGPMAKLGWGEPTLVSLSLGVIIEIPPGDIAILGVLQAGAAGRRRRRSSCCRSTSPARSSSTSSGCTSSPRCTTRTCCSSRIEGEMGAAVRLGRRRQLRRLGRRLPPAVQPAAAAVPDAAADRSRHHQRVVRADPRRRLLRRHDQHGAVRLARRVLLRLLGAVGRGPLAASTR